MFSVQIFNQLSQEGLNLLAPSLYQITDNNPDAILLRSHSLHDMPISSNLKAIARAGAGTNNIPVSKFKSMGLPVFNTPGANANAVKELVLAGMLSASRNLFQAWSTLLSFTNDEGLEKNVENTKKQFAGKELAGKVLGVIGLGAIGVKIANTALNLGMEVIAFDPQITIQNAWQLSANVNQASSLVEVFKAADYATIHVPYNEHTHHLVSSENLNVLKKTAVLLNFSRAKVVDESAVLNALNKQTLSCYVTDFPSKALLSHPKALCLPHLGASTEESESSCAIMAVKTLMDYLETGEIKNSVNFPTVSMPYNYGNRLAISNKNIPTMLSQISNQLANYKLNIIDMINRSNDDVAYTLIDVEGEVLPPILDEIMNIEGVLNCRFINMNKV
jgi:D-3-phosphoglycerate dehydrogenase / 2-oxoglutarate reductase